ncbi:2'-5'-oligoadenylate synthase-like protein 2 isoform X2 [Suricata suricatta]|uniref:2'-5'-oligoadenylate synthase-like protein 2 isoform X2 n=1 Tax=Suricata suricatta TaxID=37032 RepID=UPI0011562AB4|nr:2'-5'-oligoadenylate synthase-like protein 2 isoform X2 [Suricata suricatta]
MELFQSLYETPADMLSAFVEQRLQPEGDWKEEVKDAQKRIERFFRDQCFQDELVLDQEVRVLKVVKGGSSGKGTTLNYSSDVDLVLFLSCFPSFQDQVEHRGSIIKFIKKRLTQYGKSLAYSITIVPQRKTTRVPRSLSFHIQTRKSSEAIRVDVLPAYDALKNFCLDSKPSPEVYEDLITSGGHPGEFTPSFTELQRHFVKSRPVKLKNLLRLMKHWYQQHLKPKYRKASLPAKYALELLTIYAWEIGTDESDNFDLDEGLRAVMQLLTNYENICIYWTKYYDFQNETVRIYIKRQLKECRPVILDPADPTNNLGTGKRWDLVAKEAAHCLRQTCCGTDNSSQGWQVQPARDVQVLVKKTGEEDWTLSVDPYSPIWKMKMEIKKTCDLRGQQRLSFQEPGGERQLLSSQQTLAHYGIFSKVSIRVLETFSSEIQVFVKDSSGQSKPYAIHPDDSIRTLKEKIEEAGGPCVEDQILKFQDRKLRNHCSLSDLQIKDCDTILLTRSHRAPERSMGWAPGRSMDWYPERSRGWYPERSMNYMYPERSRGWYPERSMNYMYPM